MSIKLKNIYTKNILKESSYNDNSTVINWDKFVDGTNKTIFITGLSGSGKTTISRKINHVFSLFGIDTKIIHGDSIYNFYKKEFEQKFHHKVLNKPELKKYCLTHTAEKIKSIVAENKHYLVEGVQMFLIPTIDESFIDFLANQTIVFVNTDIETCAENLKKRETDEKRFLSLAERSNTIWKQRIDELKNKLSHIKEEDFSDCLEKYLEEVAA